jgi:GAF domain
LLWRLVHGGSGLLEHKCRCIDRNHLDRRQYGHDTLPIRSSRSARHLVGEDMGRKKRMREPSYRNEQRLAAQKRALELAVSGAPIGVVLGPVAEETRTQVSGDARVALHIVDPDGARLRFGAAAGMPELYRSAVDGFEIRPTNPACGKVAFTGERIIVEDVTIDPLWEPYRALAQQLNIRACWSFPIRSVAMDKIEAPSQSTTTVPVNPGRRMSTPSSCWPRPPRLSLSATRQRKTCREEPQFCELRLEFRRPYGRREPPGELSNRFLRRPERRKQSVPRVHFGILVASFSDRPTAAVI